MKQASSLNSRKEVIELENITTCFGTSVIHEDISMSIRSNEITALVGGSGSGKSTLLREMLMLQRPTSGSIKVFDQEITEMTDTELLSIRRCMGMLFQYSALFSGLTILENVSFPLREHTGLSAKMIKELACIKIQLVGLEASVCAKYPNELSGGMRKRAALARALALDPQLLFLDEPTAGLDPVSAGALDDLVIELQKSLDLTVVMVTHDLHSVWKMADRLAMLGNARLLAFGSVREVSGSNDPVVRSFFHGERGLAAVGETVWKHA